MRSEFALLTGALVMWASVSLSRCPVAAGIRSPGLFAGTESVKGVSVDPSLPSPFYENGQPVENYCQKLMNAKRSIYYLSTRSYKMSLQLRGIYTREGAIFFCLRLYNHSHIDYAVDSIRFLMADQKQQTKTTVQGVPLTPVYHCGNAGFIKGKSGELLVFALPRFTLPAGKRLVIEVSEKNGGRRLRLLTDNFTLVKARLI